MQTPNRILQLLLLSVIGLFLFCCKPTASQHKQSIPPQSNRSPQDCVQQILATDHSLGTIRNHACEKISLSKTIQQYTDEVLNMDFSACPTAFTKAFHGHAKAWLKLLPITDQYPELRGELHDLFKILEAGKDGEEFSAALKGVWDTWGEVEKSK